METTTTITRTRVAERSRLNILPRYAGAHMAKLESTIYQVLREYCDTYQGGYWEMYELSNGAFYMAPGTVEPMAMKCAGNWYDGAMTADAAGIVACLVAINRLAWGTTGAARDRFVTLFYALRDYAIEHAEAAEILGAID